MGCLVAYHLASTVSSSTVFPLCCLMYSWFFPVYFYVSYCIQLSLFFFIFSDFPLNVSLHSSILPTSSLSIFLSDRLLISTLFSFSEALSCFSIWRNVSPFVLFLLFSFYIIIHVYFHVLGSLAILPYLREMTLHRICPVGASSTPLSGQQSYIL